MDLTSLQALPFYGVIAAVGMFWQQVKNVLSNVRSFVLVNVILHEDTSIAFTSYCHKHFRRSPFGDRRYLGKPYFVKPVNRVQSIAWEGHARGKKSYWKTWKPIFLGGYAHDADRNSIPTDNITQVTYFRWMFDIEDLIVKALDEFNETQAVGVIENNRYAIIRIQGQSRKDSAKMFMAHGNNPQVAADGNAPSIYDRKFPSGDERILKWNMTDLGQPKPENPLGALSLNDELQDLIVEFDRWKQSEKWFKTKQVPWRRGWLLYGDPGTGKTSLVRAIAQKFDIPIYTFDLSTLSNDEMTDGWERMLAHVPCIALLEDIDAVFHGRDNVLGEQGGGLTFDCLLNCISGVQNSDGVFTIVTTNNIDKIDPALGSADEGVSSRPGRLDRAIEIRRLNEKCRREVVTRILGDWPELVEEYVKLSDGYTGAQITEVCAQLALKKYWESK